MNLLAIQVKPRLTTNAFANPGNGFMVEAQTWRAMHNRCYNPNTTRYKDWGGRGITVCERWHTLDNFIMDMGKKPTPFHSLDRVNNDLGYSPENCRWATRAQQTANRRKTTRIKLSDAPASVTSPEPGTSSVENMPTQTN